VRFVQPSAAKLNLSLRVTGKREDGYHNIVSVFLRLPSVETLLISEARCAESSEVHVYGVDIGGEEENIVLRGLRCAREAGFEIPFLDVEILKTIYPGSGLGAGSGNGAAILCWLAGRSWRSEIRDDLGWRDVALKTGADVPFLFSEIPLALISGIGEIIEPLEPFRSRFYALVVFPAWSVGTGNAYSRLDRRYGGAYPLDELSARIEAEDLCRKLRGGERVGLLPNDFTPGLIEQFPDYGKLFYVFEKKGSCAWGITGSGGAVFALFTEVPGFLDFEWPLEMRQVLSVSVP
jgi:4-diphosphocytidyl-2-C-methyl-D-erythritol kinase